MLLVEARMPIQLRTERKGCAGNDAQKSRMRETMNTSECTKWMAVGTRSPAGDYGQSPAEIQADRASATTPIEEDKDDDGRSDPMF